MSPYEIEVLLHYYYSSEDYPDMQTPPFKSTIDRFVEHGIIIPSNEGGIKFKSNREVMDVWIETITSVPLPVQKWQMP